MPSFLPPGSAVPAAVLCAAVLHALWNAMAHRITDKLVGFTLINLAYTGCAAVMVCLVPLPEAGAWPFILVSAALEVLSQLFLLRAYQLGDFGQMYPIARGTAPLLVAVASVTLLGRPIAAAEMAGVLVISAGLAGLAFADGWPGRAQLPALGAAVATGAVIAAYTVVDGTGVHRSQTVIGYIAWLFLCQGPVLPLLALARRGRPLLAQLKPACGIGLTGGVVSLTAYGLVIWAQAHGDLATIAALRETSILIAALIATLLFRERFGRLRLTAGAAVLAGIVVLELAHP
ncbi:DMT family transporter [Streptomyces sp. NBC_01591]|uniref:EamA family transporter n=1 Tax=Streptomyces sp. NBC_01591 TaxID=2975888 RepID=UPI002DDADAE5|nr:EamA family transporter [Streptomyces sp. NBC_01591]WSD66665.1 DMT family transporter [Streptomyces sp. NBC_01591]